VLLVITVSLNIQTKGESKMNYSPVYDLNNPGKVEKDDLLTQVVKQGIKDKEIKTDTQPITETKALVETLIKLVSGTS
jgi:hypothetical protein